MSYKDREDFLREQRAEIDAELADLADEDELPGDLAGRTSSEIRHIAQVFRGGGTVYIIDSGSESGTPLVGPFPSASYAEVWIDHVTNPRNLQRASRDSFVIETLTDPLVRAQEILGITEGKS